ncbi:hypothetical protein INT44_006097 [Umbelopsis vinacea]|uniref:Uncharacterized protein n=1 Tax=Umbelopsis vinacea TaxID=44442 RepID=A0A8H7PZQ2_9FUNG|nr:hypothetical protein INT44_006097 [Umbelopsis vinacea]
MSNHGDPPVNTVSTEALRQAVKQLPSNKKLLHDDFVYADSDDTIQEINEFFNYTEVAGYSEHRNIFQERISEDWDTLSVREKKSYIQYLLNDLEQSSAKARLEAGKQILYIAQGNFGDLESFDYTGDDVEQHLEKIKANNSLLQQSGALPVVYSALRKACEEHNSRHLGNIQDINDEIEIFLTILFMLLETLRHDENFATDLDNLDPPLIVFLFGVISQLREKNLKMFPVKKLLLVVWKTMLVSFGGREEIERTHNIIRQYFSLPEVKFQGTITRSTPLDLHAFSQEIVTKYPTYTLPPFPGHVQRPELIKPSSALQSLLTGNHGSSPNPPSLVATSKAQGNAGKSGTSPQQTKRVNGYSQNGHKEPLVLPFSSWDMDVPRSIQEAGEMYTEHMYVSLATLQILWERERGIKMWPMQDDENGYEFIVRASQHLKSSQASEQPFSSPEMMDAFRRLSTVESLYVSFFFGGGKAIVPNLQNIIIVLLKLLLATVTPYNGVNPNMNGHSGGNETGQEKMNNASEAKHTTQPQDIEEANNKHVLKFENVSQLLVDSGCLLLILKILGLQDMAATLQEQTEGQEYSFMNYWSRERRKAHHTYDASKTPLPESHSQNLRQTNWRNMFWSINFLRILQKLTKRKTHRIMLLVQYKSSAILKRLLKVSHPMLELYTLKVLKSQVPYLGRKWRSSNMRIITAIYLTCRPALREEWMTGLESDSDIEESAVQESNLRSLIKAYHTRRYLPTIPSIHQRQDIPPSALTNQMHDASALSSTVTVGLLADEQPSDDIELDAEFMNNYEQWLEDEVYSVPTSPELPPTDAFGSLTPPMVSPALSDSPIHQFYRSEQNKAKLTQEVSDFYHNQLQIEFNLHHWKPSGDGWDAPQRFLHSYAINPDEIDVDEDIDLTKGDPLANIDWSTLSEEDLQERLYKVERQTIQRRLRTDDESDYKLLNTMDHLTIENDDWD